MEGPCSRGEAWALQIAGTERGSGSGGLRGSYVNSRPLNSSAFALTMSSVYAPCLEVPIELYRPNIRIQR